jgi:hypothetical protein
MTGADYEGLHAHLFPGDRDEHAAILLAGRASRPGVADLLVREVHYLEADEFIPGRHGYRQLSAGALARLGSRANTEGLALITCHSHPGSGERTGLSGDDLAGHRRVFPHLLDIVGGGAPVGGIAFGEASAAGEIWIDRDHRHELDRVDVIGESHLRLRDRPPADVPATDPRFDRQARMFGAAGQRLLADMTVAVIGLGGGGSIVNEQLCHLGVGRIIAVDFDRVEAHNLSRIVGAVPRDARRRRKKVKVAARLAGRIDPSIRFEAVDGDVADPEVADLVSGADFIFVCTDTITSRLVANAIAQAYLIPMVQIGAKVDRPNDRISSVYVAVRPSFPRQGCLDCAGMIDPVALQREGATKEERAAQNYLNVPDIVDPSVVTLNGVAASAATNLMLMYAVGMGQSGHLSHRLFDARGGSWLALEPRHDSACLWCGSESASRFARGDSALLPVRAGGGRPSRVGQRGLPLRRPGARHLPASLRSRPERLPR